MATFVANTAFNVLNITEPVNGNWVSLGGGSFSITDLGISYLASGSLVLGTQGLVGTATSFSATINSVPYLSMTGLSYNTDNTNYDLGYTVAGRTLFGMTAEFAGMLAGNDTIYGSAFDDVLSGFLGNDSIYGMSGNDVLAGSLGNDALDGGVGTDTAYFDINMNAVTAVRHLKTGGAIITSSEGTDTLINIESLAFLDGSVTAGASGDVIRDFIASRPIPTFTSVDSGGNSSAVSPTLYTGPVAFLEYQYLGNTTGDVIIGSTGNDFMNLLGGDDAANGGAGDDVLDGGTGSNFLMGGGGNDTLFLDGRGGTTTWSTVTDFNTGDQVNIWGWNAGTSKLLLTDANGGAAGYTGATFHYDLDNNGSIDTSITFTGLTVAQVPTGQALSVAGNGYLLIG